MKVFAIMSDMEDLPSYPRDPRQWSPVDVTYRIVMEKGLDDEHKEPKSKDYIHIVGPLDGVEVPARQSEDSFYDTTELETAKPSSPRAEAIETASANFHMPCSAELIWNGGHAAFYCQYDPNGFRFCNFKFDEEHTDPKSRDEMSSLNFKISHTPPAFHPGLLEGIPIKDDSGKKMLFVKIENGTG